MKKMALFQILAFSLVCAASAIAQSSAEPVVVYDPLFWRHELRLSGRQCSTISEINKEFYEAIYKTLAESRGNTDRMKATTDNILQARSEKIWNTFLPGQKRKWMKLSSVYASNASRSSVSFNAELTHSIAGK
jgi:hypothetical protein